MSRHHAAHAGDVLHTLNDIESMPRSDAEKIYGIEFREGLAVYDKMYDRIFDSIGEWADFNHEQDEIEYEEDINTFKSDHAGYS